MKNLLLFSPMILGTGIVALQLGNALGRYLLRSRSTLIPLRVRLIFPIACLSLLAFFSYFALNGLDAVISLDLLVATAAILAGWLWTTCRKQS